MASSDDNKTIRITAEDLSNVSLPSTPIAQPGTIDSAGMKNYGSIRTDAEAPEVPEERGSIFLKGWFYLGAAGLVGAIAGWGICEPWFVDGEGHRWGNILLLPLLVALMCICFGLAESVVERSVKKALVRGGLSLLLGIVFGFIFDFVANIIFNIGLGVLFAAGVRTSKNPAFWIARGVAWAAFGAAGGVVYGIIGRSGKKTGYGVLGGVIGAAIGGLIFDPIAIGTDGGAPSRAVGFALLGLATGIAMGTVESALKDRWLYVTSGPLAGKQFILYKQTTTVGRDQGSDIYLFKDNDILPHHAVFEMRGPRVEVRAQGTVYVDGQPSRSSVLQSGALIRIGRYTFRYQEKHRS